MNTKLLPAALGLALLLAAPLQAQEAVAPGAGEATLEQVVPGLRLRTEALASEEVTDRVGDLLPVTERSDFDAALLQVGAGSNLVVINQQGTDNEVDVEQRGTANVAVFVQDGSSNKSTLLQDGIGNVYGVRIDGFDNELDVTQRGLDNAYILDFTGTASGAHAVEQNGVGNQLVQTGTVAAPFSVQQNGNGMVMVIEHNGGN